MGKTEFAYDAFINYASENKNEVESLVTALTNAGFSVWFDKDNLEAGDQWRSTIGAAIRQSRYFFAMLSKQSINKKSYVRREIIEAINVQNERLSKSFLVPIKLSDCELDDMPQLKEHHIVSLYEDWQNGYQKLVRILISDQQRNFTNREIIGFDLGHGETSLSKTTVLTEAEPTVLEILKGRVSIISGGFQASCRLKFKNYAALLSSLSVV